MRVTLDKACSLSTLDAASTMDWMWLKSPVVHFIFWFGRAFWLKEVERPSPATCGGCSSSITRSHLTLDMLASLQSSLDELRSETSVARTGNPANAWNQKGRAKAQSERRAYSAFQIFSMACTAIAYHTVMHEGGALTQHRLSQLGRCQKVLASPLLPKNNGRLLRCWPVEAAVDIEGRARPPRKQPF